MIEYLSIGAVMIFGASILAIYIVITAIFFVYFKGG